MDEKTKEAVKQVHNDWNESIDIMKKGAKQMQEDWDESVGKKLEGSRLIQNDDRVPSDSPPPKAIKDELDKLWEKQFDNLKTKPFKANFIRPSLESSSEESLKKDKVE